MRKKTKVPESPRNAEFYSLVESVTNLQECERSLLECFIRADTEVNAISSRVSSLEYSRRTRVWTQWIPLAVNVITLALFIYSVTR